MWINDDGKARALVTALSDKYSRKIIAATLSEAKSPEEISAEQGIPVSTCYRRIHDLLALSIIKVDKIDLANGKKSVYYKSAYRDILVKFQSNELSIDLVPNSGSPSEDVSGNLPSPIVTQDCDFCQTKGTVCKIFVTGDSKSRLSICQTCEKKMHERNTIRDVERVAAERIAQRIVRPS